MKKCFRVVSPQARAGLASAFILAALAAPASAQQGLNLTAASFAAASPTTAASTGDPQATPATPATPAPAENPVLTFFKNTELSGFVDTYYSYNFNTPKVACATIGGVAIFNCLHNFDVAHNSFSLNLAELAFEKKPTMDSRGGFRVDLDYGTAASIVGGTDNGGSAVYQHIQQAYLSYLAPAGKGTIQFDFGKFVTPAGNEVIETKDNWNYSRSLLFALAIPYDHMGLRAAYSPNDKVTVTGFLFNGWNNSVDNNGGKSVGVSVSGKVNDKLTIVENYIGGPEQANDNSDWRHLSDTVVSYTVNKMTSIALNYDWGTDKGAPSLAAGGGTSSTWQGVAAYLKYQANDWFAVTPRYEYLKDSDGFMTGVPQDKLQEFTLTLEFKHKDGVMMRVEYRGDFADVPYFVKDSTPFAKKNQQALIVGWVYTFSTKTP